MPEDLHNVTAGNPVAWYRAGFERFEQGLNGDAGSRVHALRQRAIGRFAELGFPTTHEEEWRFTNVAPIAAHPFTPAPAAGGPGLTPQDIEQFLLSGVKSTTLVFVNGHFARSLSRHVPLPSGVQAGNLAAAMRANPDAMLQYLGAVAPFDEDSFTALSTAFLRDGAVVRVSDGCTMEHPIHLLYIATDAAEPFLATPRNLVVMGKNTRASVIEHFVHTGRNRYFTNAVTEIVVGEDAVLEYDKIQNESPAAFHVGTIHVRQGRGSTFVSNAVSFGGSLVRNTVTATLGAENIGCTLNGLSLATGSQLIDNHTTIDHAFPHCTSHELYKCILDGTSHGVFNGRIFVRKDAQKTDAKQTNKTLLLSDEATIDTKPQLEIFADDVKCTHGATIGQLDDEQVFYLRSRGIGLTEARDLLTRAFAIDVIGRIGIPTLRDRLEHLLFERLEQGRLAGEVEG